MEIEGARLRRLRLAAAWTQQELADRARISLRAVKYAEAGRSSGSTTTRLAAVLRVPSRSLVVRGPVDLESMPPGFLFQQTVPAAGSDVVQSVREGAVADMRRDFVTAKLRIEKALEAGESISIDSRAQLNVKKAIALDNSGDSRGALALLEPWLAPNRLKDVTPETACWLKYHVALACRRIAEMGGRESGRLLKRAGALLREVEYVGDREQRIAATHQIACVWLVLAIGAPNGSSRGRSVLLRRASRAFVDAAHKWRRNQNFREGYSLRRLAEIALLKGDSTTACRYLLDALEVFARFECYRYRDEVRAQLEGLFDGRVYGHAQS